VDIKKLGSRQLLWSFFLKEISVNRSEIVKKGWVTRRARAAGKKATLTRKGKAVGTKAAVPRRRPAHGRKPAVKKKARRTARA
jgi:hypothetical protein